MSILTIPVTSQDHLLGDINAPLTLVEYGDYECPYCGAAHGVVKRLIQHFGKQIRFVFRNFPLTQIHPYAETAAETAEFAGTHSRFWEMHDLLYENQEQFSPEFFVELAETLSLPADDLEQALENKTYEPKIRSDFLGGVRSGVNGTPTFFINDERYNGPNEYEDLVAVLEAALV